MNYYFLPGIGVFGGIKVGYQFADLLNEAGSRTVVVTPDGRAPTWFQSSAPTLADAEVLPRMDSEDNLLFSLPHDHARLSTRPGRLVFHCQGTDPLIDPVIRDPRATLLTCWPQATRYVHEKAVREPIEVGISVSDIFYYRGQPKWPGTVAYMPRRGAELAASCATALPHLRFVPIDGASEQETAAILNRCEFYLATAHGEWFGLPALEAMAAGCVVLSVPSVGGVDYLHTDVNAIVVEGPGMIDLLRSLAGPGAAGRRARLRDHARVTAQRFRLSRQRTLIASLLPGPLSFLQT
jgi:glycosyltransferase involved in cell wall biosynthesis